jgi:hypothetical protein
MVWGPSCTHSQFQRWGTGGMVQRRRTNATLGCPRVGSTDRGQALKSCSLLALCFGFMPCTWRFRALGRLDFVLDDSAAESSLLAATQYLQLLHSHTNYWTRWDAIHFVAKCLLHRPDQGCQ